MNESKIKAVLALVAAVAVVFILYEMVNGYFQIGNKEEWSVLQVVESKNRLNTDASGILIVSENGYKAIGIRVDSELLASLGSKYPRVWLLAAPRYREMVKELPQNASFTITQPQLQLILREAPDISAATLKELRKHLRE